MHFQMFMLQAKTDRAARAGDKALARENEREVDPEKLMARVLEHRHLGKVMESKWNLDPFSTVDVSSFSLFSDGVWIALLTSDWTEPVG